MRRSGNRVRITTQQIVASNGSHIWAERYDRDLQDIFSLQDEITETVVGAIIRQSGGDIWLTFVEAATALAHLEQIDKAKEMVVRMRSVQPSASVSAVRNAFNFNHPDSEQHYLDGLRRAGLPE